MILIRHTLITALAGPLALAMLAGCAVRAELPKTSDAVSPACIAPGTWFAPAQGQSLKTPEALARLKAARVVLLGETHVIADHHRWHMQTVAQLYAQHPDMILAFEAFPRRVQPVLDQWVAGKLSEAEFLKQSEWETVWRYDAELYLPLFHFARLNGVPMVALNVDRDLINQVSQKGWKALPEAERGGITTPAPPSDGYIKMLGEAYGEHDKSHGEPNGVPNDAPKAPGLDDPSFAGFVDAQATWDRAMAEAAAAALSTARAQGRNPQLVAVIGRGHMDYGYGVPHQLKDLGIGDVQVVVPWDDLRACEDLKASPPPADLVFSLKTTEDYLPNGTEGPKLGVLIENAEGGVAVKEVLNDSIAEATKLKSGDLIVRAAGQPLAKSGDLVAIIKAMRPGTWLPLTIRRGNAKLDLVARFPAAQP